MKAQGFVAGFVAAASLLVLALPPPALAAQDGAMPLSTTDQAAVRVVIENQIAAFQRDDGVEAFSYASPSVQAIFGNPENFMRMVRNGYRPVYRPRQVFFQEAVLYQGRLVQALLVTDQDGDVVIALYTMEQQPDGSWRIGSVVLLPTRATGA